MINVQYIFFMNNDGKLSWVDKSWEGNCLGAKTMGGELSRVEKDGRGNVWVEKKTGEESSWVAKLTGEHCPGGELYGYNFNMMITILSTTRHHKTF